jgi:hypothetical protein
MSGHIPLPPNEVFKKRQREYDVVSSTNLKEFVYALNRKILEGWQVSGEIATAIIEPGVCRYIQRIERKIEKT